MTFNLHASSQCPWCKSTNRAVTLDVPGMGHHCYSDWHSPLCVVCGESKYEHGFAWSCKTYAPAVAA